MFFLSVSLIFFAMEKVISDPRLIGVVLRELFIVRDDGSVDFDMVVALARAADLMDARDNGEGR